MSALSVRGPSLTEPCKNGGPGSIHINTSSGEAEARRFRDLLSYQFDLIGELQDPLSKKADDISEDVA